MRILSEDDKVYLINFGKRVKEIRLQKGLSQSDLAFKCNYTDRSTISRIENGDVDVSHSIITRISLALGVSPCYLLGWEENTNNGVNNGIIGNNNNNNIINGVELDEIEAELLSICSKMTVTQKARLLTYANDLLDK